MSFSFDTMLSTFSAESGPTAPQVTVPGSTTVWPASVIVDVVMPRSYACCIYW